MTLIRVELSDDGVAHVLFSAATSAKDRTALASLVLSAAVGLGSNVDDIVASMGTNEFVGKRLIVGNLDAPRDN